MSPKFSDIRQRFQKTEQLRSQIIEALDTQDDLNSKVKRNAELIEKAQVLRALEQLPVDRLRDASKSSFKIEYLRRSGFDNMRQIYESTVSRIAAVNGISPEGAREIKSIADAMHTAISATVAATISADLELPEEVELVRVLDELSQVNSALQPVAAEIPKMMSALDSAHEHAAKASRRLKWWFLNQGGKEKAISAVDFALVAVSGVSAVSAISAVGSVLAEKRKEKKSESALRREFEGRSSDFYALLEKVQDRPRSADQLKHFSAELIAQIEAQDFDHSHIKATLRKYQLFGTKFALTQKRVILGDEMGLGKTMQAMGVLTERAKAGANRFLIVVPASVIINWTRELLDRTNLTPIKIHGEGAKAALQSWITDGGLALTTFDTLKSFDLDDVAIDALNLDTLIVDEAHFAKNLGTGRSREIQRWAGFSEYVIFLTGTPMENRVGEFMGLVGVINPQVASGLDAAVLASGPEPFKVAVASVYLRRNTAEVLKELPELIEKDELCDWVGVDKTFYENAVRTSNFMAMRRAAYVPAAGFRPSKIERLLELVEAAHDEGQKVIVFSFFKSVINYVAQELGELAMEPITGSVSAKRRQEIVDQFSQSPEPRVLVGQIQAAGTGLNIQSASVVILCEPQIKPTLETQAIARAHRMGQVRKVRVHRLIIENSVDSGMREMLARKTEEFDFFARESALAEGSASAKDMSEQSVAKAILTMERERLGVSEPVGDVVLTDDEEL